MAAAEENITEECMACVDDKGKRRKEEIRLFNDHCFKKVRDLVNLSEDFLLAFDFGTLKPGGGKGGDLMAFTEDGNFLVKEVKDCDQESLIKYADSYAKHMSRGKGSLLCQFYKHFQRKSNGQNFVVMNNFLPTKELILRGGREGVPGAAGKPVSGWDGMYDLKGCMDDKTQVKAGLKIEEVHKRFFKFWMFCCPCTNSDQREIYAEGKRQAFSSKFECTKAQQESIKQMIKDDAKWIADCNMMDHSLMVGVASHTKEKVDSMIAEGKSIIGIDKDTSIFPRSVLPDQPYICEHRGRIYALYVGIIDYLQDWNPKKACARCIKVCAPHPKSTEPPDVFEEQFNKLSDRFMGQASACEQLLMNVGAHDEQTALSRFDGMTEMRFGNHWDDVEVEDPNCLDSPTPVDGFDCDQLVDYSTDFHQNSWFGKSKPAAPANETETTESRGWFGFRKTAV